MLRSMLVALDGSAHSATATALALDWARRFGARLLGLGVLDEPSILGGEAVPLGGRAYKQARDEARLADALRRVMAFLEEFRARSADAGVLADVLEDVGHPAHRIMLEAQCTDLVILAREIHFHFETQDRPDHTLGEILRASPRPVVVVPRDVTGGHGVVVAYNASRECVRTLQTVQLLGLAGREPLDVLTVHRDRAESEAIAQLAGAFLSAHGASHRLHVEATDAAPAAVILDAVRTRRPRLVVMGTHAHHPALDLFPGSVARRVLAASPVPVLLGA